MDFWAFGARGSEIVVASRHYGDNPVGGTTLSLLSQNEDRSRHGKACLDVVRRIYRNPEPPALLPNLSRRIRGRNRKHHGFFLRRSRPTYRLGRNRRFQKSLLRGYASRRIRGHGVLHQHATRAAVGRQIIGWLCDGVFGHTSSRGVVLRPRSCSSPSATMRRNAPKCSCPWTTRRTAASRSGATDASPSARPYP